MIQKKQFYRFLLLFMVLMLVLLDEQPSLVTAQQQPDEQPLAITLTSKAREGDAQGNPINIAGKDITTVTIELTGSTCPIVERTTPVDVVLVIDVSGSMAGEKLEQTKVAAQSFVTRFNLDPNNPAADQVAVVAFDNDASIISGLSRNVAELQAGIGALSEGGGTDIAAGLSAAADILDSPAQNFAYGAQPVIVLLSDGGSDANAAMNQADRARRNVDARVVTIGLGDVDRATLTSLADTPRDAYFTANAADLATIYDQIATQIQPRIAATNVVVTYRYNRSLYEFQDGSDRPTATISGDTITWTFSRLDVEDSTSFSFDVRSTSQGEAPVGTLEVSYNACEEEIPSIQTDDGPIINTVLATATPLPTATSTPTETPTPTITPTATDVASVVGVIERAAPSTEGVTSDYCANEGISSVWSPFWLFVAILLTLVVLGFGWRAANQQSSIMMSLCVLPWVLFLIWSIFLGYLLLLPLESQFCERPESVYFRSAFNSVDGVFLSHENWDEGNTPAQAHALNEAGCIGCHIVNDESERIAAILGPVPGQIVVSDFDNQLIDLPNNIRASYLAFSPDGRQLAFSDANADIQILDLESLQVTPLAGASDPAVSEIMPTWSADGEIAFVRGDLSEVTNLIAYHRSAIYTVPADGSQPATELIGQDALAGVNYYPAYSPDGRWLAFTNTSQGDSYRNIGSDIYLYDRTTNEIKAIENNTQNAMDAWPSWNDSSDQLAFHTNRDDALSDIYIVDIDANGVTSNARPLPNASVSGILEHMPTWGAALNPDSIFDEWLGLFPAYFLFLLPIGLLWLLCRFMPQPEVVEESGEITIANTAKPVDTKAIYIRDWQELPVLWKPQPTLIIGLGHSGRHVLTFIKKNLQDAGLGELPASVPLLCVVTGSQAKGTQKSYTFAGTTIEPDEMIVWQDSLNSLVDSAQYNQDRTLREWVVSNRLKNIDPLSGFEEQRTAGRLALIHNLRGQATQTKTLLWDKLQTLAKQAIGKDNRLNVIIVSALNDAVGSSVIADMGYLVRQLEPTLKAQGQHVESIRVTTHLLVEPESKGDSHLQANIVATLRELKRFQMANNVIITYRSDEQSTDPVTNKVEDTIVRGRLFDELYVYDGEGDSRLSNSPLSNGFYPSIADSITMWLDSAAQEAGFSGWRDGALGDIHRLQNRESELLFSSTGIYEYRLPFADLLRDITLKFSRQLLQMLLVGERDISPKWDPDFVTENFVAGTETPTDLAKYFLQGRLGNLSAMNADMQEVVQAIPMDDDTELAQRLKSLNRVSAQDFAAFKQSLNGALSIVLNGRPQTQKANPIVQKTAKLGLVKSILDSLQDQWFQVGIDRISRVDSVHPMIETLQNMQGYVKSLNDQVNTLGEALGIGNLSESLYRHLGNQAAAQEDVWKDIQKVQSRQYILQDSDDKKLTDVWYETYLVKDNIAQALAQFYWVFGQNGNIELRLRLGDKDERVFDPQDPTRFEKSLNQLAQYFARGVRDQESLTKYLRDGKLHKDEIHETAATLANESPVNLGVQEGRAIDSKASYVLSVNANIESNNLDDELKNQNLEPLRLKTSNPFALSFLKILDTIPESSVNSLEQAREQYNADQYMVGGVKPPTSVFEPEAAALDYERGIEERKTFFERARRLLHADVVSNLYYRPIVEVFLLSAAAALQLPHVEDAQYKAEWTLDAQGLRFVSDAWTGNLLSAKQVGNGNLLVQGIRALTTQMPIATAEELLKQYELNDDLLEVLGEWLDDGGAVWRQQANLSTQAAALDDWIAVTQLLILRLLGD